MNMSIGGPAGRTGTRHDSVTTLTPRSNFRPCPATGVARARERSTLCRRRPCANLHLPAPICTQVIRACLCCHSGSATRPPNPRRARSALAVARLLCARCLSVWPVLARGPFTSPNCNCAACAVINTIGRLSPATSFGPRLHRVWRRRAGAIDRLAGAASINPRSAGRRERTVRRSEGVNGRHWLPPPLSRSSSREWCGRPDALTIGKSAAVPAAAVTKRRLGRAVPLKAARQPSEQRGRARRAWTAAMLQWRE